MSHVGKTLPAVFIALLWTSVSANAQPIGTFRWQMQPYCNVVTVNVTQQNAIYTLDGTDDRCADSQAASVVGVAFLHPTGMVGFGLSIVLPGGIPVHVEATISMASLSGTWRNSAGQSGTFTFTPGAGTGGAPRPVPSSAHLADAPRAVFASGDQVQELTDIEDRTVRSVTINAPAPGQIIVNASGYFTLADTAEPDAARCSITTGTIVDLTHRILVEEQSVAAMSRVPFGGTRGLVVDAAGPVTINLVCNEVSGNVSVENSSLTAIYVAGS
jgi:hypothetical protein